MTVIETGGVYNVPGIKKRQNDTLVLDADVLNGTVGEKDENLSVSATISVSDLKGTVSYLGITGDLEGRISEDVVQGAFSGEMGADFLRWISWRSDQRISRLFTCTQSYLNVVSD